MGVYKLSNVGGFGTTRTRYGSMLAGNTTYVPTAYQSIATVTVGAGGTSNVSFTSIPSTYKHLQIRISANQATSSNMLNIKVNGDTTTGYAIHSMNANGTSTGANNATSVQYARMARSGGIVATANTFTSGIIDIVDYANTNKYKTFKMLSGTDLNGSGTIEFESALWLSTSAITQLDLFCTNNFSQYSSFALYGIVG